MFTGLIERCGKIVSKSDTLLCVDTGKAFDSQIGDSIAINGACLTVTKIDSNNVYFATSHETQKVTNLKYLSTGSVVNLERALPANGRLHGHFVMGHVDGLGRIVSITNKKNYIDVVIEFDSRFRKWIVDKGSVTVNGVSLTVNELIGDEKFNLTIIPHTYDVTNIGLLKANDMVNLEFDILSKYVENSFLNGVNNKKETITEDYLRSMGYAK